MTIDHEYTDCIVCPHCGYENWDSFIYHMKDQETTELDCEECGETFKVTCDVVTRYSTRTLEEDEK